jgi:hypothetical protein
VFIVTEAYCLQAIFLEIIMSKSTAEIMIATAANFVATCDDYTIDYLKQHSSVKLGTGAIDADEALYNAEGFNHRIELFDTNDVLNEQLWNVYCSALNTEFLKQHNIVTNFY